MAKLYIMCGPSGCGKTTWVKWFVQMKRNTQELFYVSRDEIRFEMLADNEEYFAHEKEVFSRFVQAIATTLQNNIDVLADATHLNEFSRRKLTQAIDMQGITDYEIVYVAFTTPVDTCLARNQLRSGRAQVPENIIRNMCRDFRMPTVDEDERAIEVMVFDG